MERLKLALALVALVPVVTPAQAQIEPGVRVRVTVAKPYARGLAIDVGSSTSVGRDLADHKVAGTLVALDTETLSLRVGRGSQPLVVLRTAVEKFEVSLGRASALRRAGKGALIGTAILVPTFLVLSGSEDDEWTGPYVAMGAILGTSVGALVGLGSSWERWEAVEADRVRVSLLPARGRGVALVVALSF